MHRQTDPKGSQIKDGKDVVKKIWAILYESYRLRVVEGKVGK